MIDRLPSHHGSNMKMVNCVELGKKQSYFLCQSTIEAKARGVDMKGGFAACRDKMTRGECVAVKMQQEEIEAGAPLFYEPYPNQSHPYLALDKKGDDMTDWIFDKIEEIAATSGKNAKQELVGENINNSEFFKVVSYAYDPFKVYGLKKMLDCPTHGDGQINNDTYDMLDQMSQGKLTGNAAKQAVLEEMTRLTEKSATLLRRILLKDMRAGFTASTINKVKPDSIFVFECQLAHPFYHKKTKKPRDIKWPAAVEPKYDGNRALLIYDDDAASFYSRTGKVFEAVQWLADDIAARLSESDSESMVIDGEITNGSFLETVGAVRRKSEQIETAVFVAFDAMPYGDFPHSDKSYTKRRALTKQLVEHVGLSNMVLTEAKIAKSIEQAEKYCERIQNAGGEGIIIKSIDGKYKAGRSYDWLKIKGEEVADLVIVGFERGEKGKQHENTLGAFVVDFNGKEVSVSNMPLKIRHEVWADKEAYLNRLIEVEYHEVTEYGSLRHPRFKRFRDDKPMEDGVGC